MSFEPELGQYAFSNTPWQEHEMQSGVECGLLLLGEILEGLGLVEANPCFNSGTQYENATFAIRSYCWCDGVRVEKHWLSGEPWGHPDGCPPNFQWRDFRAAWYKHVSRGNSQNRLMDATEQLAMMAECLASVVNVEEESK